VGKKVTTTIRIDADLLKQIKLLCLERDTSMQKVIVDLLSKWVSDEQNKKTSS
jgi:hypothetical protein